MAEKPIIFSGPMVRAILDGRKTQTRRALSRSNTLFNGMPWPKEVKFSDCDWPSAWIDSGPSPAGNPGPYLHVQWPYGKLCDGGTDELLWARVYPRLQPGARLWVREAFADTLGMGFDKRYHYAADVRPGSESDQIRKDYGVKWKPSIHMPRWASRITLRVIGVKVERLQDISEADAIEEGVCKFAEQADRSTSWQGLKPVDRDAMVRAIYGSARRAFQHLWESINGENSWQDNPWVAAYTFEMVR